MKWNRFSTAGLLLCLMMFAAGSAWSDCGCGFVLEAKDGSRIDAPALGTTVEVRVTGIVARARVTQIFQNPSGEWLTGTYLFPLPDGAAVDALHLVVGDRKMEGVVQTRVEARETLKTAEREGRKASLVEQVRPGLYTTSVANVGPGEIVEVEIELQQIVRWESGRFVLRFPMLAPPRYTPLRKAVHQEQEIEQEIPQPPVVSAGAGSRRQINPFAFHVDLSPGFPLAQVKSPTHKLAVEQDRKRLRWAVDLARGVAPSDGDFILEWTPAVGREPRAVYFLEEVDGERYSLLMMIPPGDRTAVADRLPRETIFVIDHSGSMQGTALQQAKEALYLGVSRLQPGDWFNVIRFCQRSTPLFPESVAVTPESLEQARQFISDIQIDGGTEMLPALKMALGGPVRPGLVQQVVFATDGQVSNEEEILRFLRSQLADRRLFTVAIGPAPNSSFLRRAAESGRGALTQIPVLDEVAKGMAELFERLESPMLRDIGVRWPDPSAEAWPAQVPDLYFGEPLVVAAHLGQAGPVTVSGLRNGSAWQDELPAPAVVKGAGLDKLWAGRKVQALMDSLRDGADPQEVYKQVTELGLRHHLVTNLTSLVAVDVEATVPAGVKAKRRLIPLSAPRGSGAGDVITVTAESPLLDARRISTGATVNQAELEKLASARDPWAILQATPGVLADRVNVGGNESGQQSFAVDGIILTDMAALGASPGYFDSFEEMQWRSFEDLQWRCRICPLPRTDPVLYSPVTPLESVKSSMAPGLLFRDCQRLPTKEISMRSTSLVTAAVFALSLSTVAWGDDRWGNNPHGDQDWYRHSDRSNYGRVSELAREVARTADSIHREYERNNRRPNRDEARVAVALHQLEDEANRFYDRVDGYGDRRDSRRGSGDFENLLRAFDATADTLRYIRPRPYVDRGMERIWSLLTEMDRGYGVSGRYGRGYGRNRYDDRYDRDGYDRYDRRDRRDDDRYRPPHN
jgi:Ca-activated chloride channel family protein